MNREPEPEFLIREIIEAIHKDQIEMRGAPYLLDARTGEFRVRSDAKRAAMGFCGKNIEVADEFLKEADRDPNSPRSQKLRKQALDLIATFIRILPMSPPAGDGFDIFTGQIIPASWSIGQQPLLTINTDLRTLTLAYEREKEGDRPSRMAPLDYRVRGLGVQAATSGQIFPSRLEARCQRSL